MGRQRKSYDEQIAGLRTEFLVSLAEKLDPIELAILKFDGKKREDLELDFVLREIHSIKGAGGTYGLQIITDICHLFEDQILMISNETIDEEITNVYLSLLDKLRQVVIVNLADYSAEAKTRKMVDLWESASKYRAKTERLSVMVVEGSRAATNLIQNILADLGVDTDFYTDAYTALGRLVSKPYDVLISGNRLNHISGAGLISAIKLSDNLPNLATGLIVSDLKSTQNLPKSIAPDMILLKSKDLGDGIIKLVNSQRKNRPS